MNMRIEQYDAADADSPARSHRVLLVSTVAFGIFSEAFLYGVLIPVLPNLLRDQLGIEPQQLQWYASAMFTIAGGSGLFGTLLVAAVGDRLVSQKAPFFLGLVFITISAPISFATNLLPVMFIARGLQGAAGGLIWAAGFTLCFESLQAGRIGLTMGMILSCQDIGTVISPPIGGWLYTRYGSWSLAATQIGIMIVAVALCLLSFGQDYVKADGLRDTSEVPNETIGLLTEEEDADHDMQLSTRKSRIAKINPILVCFGSAAFTTGIALCVMKSAVFGAFDATVPLQANDLFHLSPFKRGLLFVPFTGVRLLGAPLGGWLVDRFGPKVVASTGYTFLAPVLVAFRTVHSEPRNAQIALFSILLALIGMGMSIVASSSFVTVNAVMRKYHVQDPALFGERLPTASLNGIYLAVFNVGLSLGPILAGALQSSLGYGNMHAVLAGLTCLSAAAAWSWLSSKADISDKPAL